MSFTWTMLAVVTVWGGLVGAMLSCVSLLALGGGEGSPVFWAATVPFCMFVPTPVWVAPALWGVYYAVSASLSAGLAVAGIIVVLHGLGAYIAYTEHDLAIIPLKVAIGYSAAFLVAVVGCWWVGRVRHEVG